MKTLHIVFFMVFISLAAGAQSSYTVTQATGRVEIRTGGGAWQSIGVGDVVPVSASISTGFGSRAVLEGAGARITVEALTRMTVDQLKIGSEGESESSLRLRTGRIRASVRSTEAGRTRFQVSSPVATAAVRGTEFGFNGYAVDVFEGTVSLASGTGGRNVNVPQGVKSKVDENGDPQTVAESRGEQSIVDSSAVPDTTDPVDSAGKIGGSSGPQTLTIIIE